MDVYVVVDPQRAVEDCVIAVKGRLQAAALAASDYVMQRAFVEGVDANVLAGRVTVVNAELEDADDDA